MGMTGSIGKKIMKEEMENNNVIMCHFWQSPWWRNKGKTQKKKVPHNLYAIHAKHVTIILEDIQIALQYLQWKSCKEENKNSICGAELKQYSICGAELEQRRQENKMTKDEFSASYLTKKTRSKTTKDEFYVFYLKKKIIPPLKID